MNSEISKNFDGLLPTMKQNKTPMGPPISFGQWEEGIQERILWIFMTLLFYWKELMSQISPQLHGIISISRF